MCFYDLIHNNSQQINIGDWQFCEKIANINFAPNSPNINQNQLVWYFFICT